jgi:hypothetical protein
MRALITILDGQAAQAKSEEPTLLQPEKPSMPTKPKVLHVKKTTITKQVKAQDTEKAKTNEAIRKAITEFTSKNVPSKSRATSLPPKQQMPALSFDEIAEQLDSESFLDNPLDRKRDTRKREEMASRGASNVARPAASSSALTRPASSAAVRPASGTRILKTQRADSVGQRRTTLESRLR